MPKRKAAPAKAPVEFSEEVFDRICARIADGESLRKICESDDMPSTTAVTKWLAKDAATGTGELVAQYAHAREQQADTLFDDCLNIADQYDQAAENGEGGTDHIQRARLRIDTRKWMAGKLRPKRYGERIAVGGDKDMDPIQTEEKGAGAAKLAAAIEAIAERSRAAGEPGAE